MQHFVSHLQQKVFCPILFHGCNAAPCTTASFDNKKLSSACGVCTRCEQKFEIAKGWG